MKQSINSLGTRGTLAGAALLALLLCAEPAWALAADAKPPAPVAKASNAPPAEVVVPRAMFVPNGRDPFFPDSVRVQRPVQTSISGTTPVPPPVVKRNPYDFLKIDGLIGGRRPTVSINQVTLLKGDKDIEVAVMMPDERNVLQAKKIKVTCIDIKQRSAVIQAEGEPTPKELFWKDQ